MIIERIDVDRFGGLAGVTIDGLRAGVEVLHGTNETGKTSLLEFVRAAFFGFGSLFRRGVLDPHRACGGRLLARAGLEGRRIVVERRHDGPHLDRLTAASYAAEDTLPSADSLTVLDADADAATPLFLRDFIGDVDERTFTSVMAFGLDELHELRTLDAEGCGSRLYELASGLDRSKVALVLANIRAALERLDADDAETSPIAALRQRRGAALARLAAMNAPALEAGTLALELARLDADLAACGERAAAARAEEEKVRALLPLVPLHAARVAAAARLAELEATPALHPDFDAWELASRHRDDVAREARRRKRVRVRLARELAEVPDDTVIRRKRAALAALCDEQPRYERLAADVARAEAEARQAARRFGEALGVAGLARLVGLERSAGAARESLADAPLPAGLAHPFGPLRARAREYRSASAAVRAARGHVAEIRGSLDTTRGSIEAAGAGIGAPIAAAIEEASGRVALYRNRLSSGDQLAQLDQALARIEGELAASRDAQLLPVGWLIGLGAVFVLGVGMLLSGLLLPAAVTGSLAYALAALGLAGTGLASVATWSLDRAASARFDAARRQHEMAGRQRADLVAHLAALDKRIDAGRTAAERVPADVPGALERRAAAAQAELDRLEGLAAREGSLHVLADRATAADQDLARALERRAAARGRWRRALEHRGLPTTLTTAAVRAIASHRHALVSLDDERRRTSDDARLRREELVALGRRIEEALADCDMPPEGGPLEQLEQLRERLDRDAAARAARRRLERRLRIARERHRAAVRRVRLADRRVGEIVARWKATSEQDFLALVDRRPAVDSARRESRAAEAAWHDARRLVTHADAFADWFTAAGAVSLDQRLAEAHAAAIEAAAEAARAADRRRAATARVEASARDRSTEGVQLEIAEIEQELEAHLHRRTLLERAARLLEETRAAFARDHQPAVLREASRWLGRLTDGRYTSITTSIHEASLQVHDAEGAIWSPDRLSRGTREQVFLALRLALVRDLERHGVHLPVVIDDALVNFDDARARSAARVLVDFVGDEPRSRQMLVLTCHEHVARIFAAAGAHVRSLSNSPATPAERPADAAWEAEEFFFGSDSTRSERSAPRPTADRPRRRRRR